MALSLAQFVDHLATSGLLSSGDVQLMVDNLPANQRPKTVKQLARLLVEKKMLTAYQAQQTYSGKGQSLVLGNYVILDKLGQGGMGIVFKAEHKRMERVVGGARVAQHAVQARRLQARLVDEEHDEETGERLLVETFGACGALG